MSTNFNPLRNLFGQLGSFIGSSAGSSTSSGLSNLGGTGLNAAAINSLLRNSALTNQQSLNLLRLATGMSLAMLFQQEGMNLSPEDNAQFVKDLLKLPKDMRLLLASMALENESLPVDQSVKRTLQEMIKNNLSDVPIEQFQNLIGDNSKDAAKQLMKLLQNTQSIQIKNGQQIMELASQMEKLSTKVKESPKHATETLMLLYLPWYPLQNQQKLELGFGFGGGEDDEDVENKEASVVLYLDTNTLGRFKVVLEEADPLQVIAKVFHQEAGKGIMPVLKTGLNEFLAQEGLPAAIFMTDVLKERPQGHASLINNEESTSHVGSTEKALQTESVGESGFKGATRRDDNKQISAQQGERVSMLVLNSAYELAKLIFAEDGAGTTLQAKK